LQKLCQRTISIRYQTPRRIKNKVFRRGYQDHGSRVEETQKSRRRATEDFYTVIESNDFVAIFELLRIIEKETKEVKERNEEKFKPKE